MIWTSSYEFSKPYCFTTHMEFRQRLWLIMGLTVKLSAFYHSKLFVAIFMGIRDIHLEISSYIVSSSVLMPIIYLFIIFRRFHVYMWSKLYFYEYLILTSNMAHWVTLDLTFELALGTFEVACSHGELARIRSLNNRYIHKIIL